METPEPQTLLVQGHDVPELELTDPASMKVKNLKSFGDKKTVATFFSTFCGMCKSADRIRSLEKLEKALGKKKKAAKFILVFSKPYDEMDIVEWEKRMDMPFEKYITENIFSDQEKYVTDDTLKTDPLTVVLDGSRKVLFVEKVGMTEAQVMTAISDTFK